jgi:hypothetical protein
VNKNPILVDNMKKLLIVVLLSFLAFPCLAATRYKILSTKDISVVSGNVGIGTTAPGKLFAVDGAVYMKGNVGIGTTSPVGLLQIAGTGNVGIGTTTTPGRLSVDGSIYQKGTDCSTACWVNGFAGCKDTGTCVAR